MKRAATTLLCAVSLALTAPAAAHAVTLVGPSGQPVGGVWQQWADEAKTPTITGNLTLVVSDTRPCLAAGCSSSPVSLAIDASGQLTAPWASNPTVTWMAPDAPQWTFYWELGHQFDWAVLTDAERHQFADVWRSSLPWWDSVDALNRSTEDGLESTFAAVYANCASGTPSAVPGGWVVLQLADPEANCVLINQIAGMPRLPVVSSVTVTVATQHRARQHRHRRSRSVLRRHRRA